MVYMMLDEETSSVIGLQANGQVRIPKIKIEVESKLTKLFILLLKILIATCDIITLPYYYLRQRPDRSLAASWRPVAHKLDANTWAGSQATSETLGQSYSNKTAAQCQDGKLELASQVSSVSQLFVDSVRRFGERKCIGYRALVSCPSIVLPGDREESQTLSASTCFRSDFTWYSYEQIGRRVQDIAAGLRSQSVVAGSRVLLLASTSLEWFASLQAAFQLGLEVVLAPAISDEQLLWLILDEAKVQLLFISCDKIPLIARLLQRERQERSNRSAEQQQQPRRLAKIVLIDWKLAFDFTEEHLSSLRDSASDVADQLLSLGELEELGVETSADWQASRMPIEQQVCKNQPDELALIVYNEDSTGVLRGRLSSVALSHSHLLASVDHLRLNGLVQNAETYCTILSLDNILELITELAVLAGGGSIGFSSDPDTLFYDGRGLLAGDQSDLAALSPTLLLARPFELERFQASAQNYLTFKLNPLKSLIMTHILVGYKQFWAQNHFETPLVDRLFCSELRALFGPKQRLRLILSDGPLDCAHPKLFFAHLFGLPLVELFGPALAPASLVRAGKPASAPSPAGLLGHLLCSLVALPRIFKPSYEPLWSSSSEATISTSWTPTLGSLVRLTDWHEFKLSDRPLPRGRLALSRRQDQAIELDESWFETNELARGLPNGSFELVSNVCDLVRLLDGQSVSLGQVEHILRSSHFVDNVCAVYDQHYQSVVALVVPNLRRLALKSPNEANLKLAIGLEPEPEELCDLEFRREICNDRLLCEFLRDHLARLVRRSNLEPSLYRFHLVGEIWSPESGLVTPAMQPKREAIARLYATDIESVLRLELERSNCRLSDRLPRQARSNSAKTTRTRSLRSRLSC